MLVDNAVVVLESIVRKQEHGMDRREAARRGTAEVAMAVTAATLTSVAVFFPMVFITGVAGQLFKDQSLTVSFALAFSLVVALTLVPMLAAGNHHHVDAAPAGAVPGRARRRFDGALSAMTGRARRVFGWIARGCALVLSPLVRVTQAVNRWADRKYPPAITWALDRPGQVIGGAVAFFVLTLVLIVPRLGTELIPQMSQGEFNVDLRLPAGTPLEATDRAVVAAQLASTGLGNVDLAYSVAGTGNRLDANPVDCGGEHRAPQHHARARLRACRGRSRHGGHAQEPGESPGRAVPVQPPQPVRAVDAARGRGLGLRPRPAA